MTETLQPTAPQKTWLSTTVRYGKMAYTATFKTDRTDLRKLDKAIVRTDRGRELGTVLTVPVPIPEGRPAESLWDLIRKASADDVNNAIRVDSEHRVRELDGTRQAVKRLNLQMKIVDVDHIFGGERVVIYFMSELRVDFRELVRTLAHEFRTRIELRQIGARDEARRLDGIGRCGRQLCIASWLPEGRPVSLALAKDQGLSLNPMQISGPCGRLLCCLHYEHDFYVESRRRFPKEGKSVRTATGPARVIAVDIFRERVTVRAEGGETRVLALADLRRESDPAGPAGAD